MRLMNVSQLMMSSIIWRENWFKPSWLLFWIHDFFMHTYMGLRSMQLMILPGFIFQDFLAIQWTLLKSICFNFEFAHGLIFNRILVSCLKYLSTYPCPRCLIPKDKFYHLGMVTDMKQRISKARVDSVRKQGWVQAARRNIFVEGAAVSSTSMRMLDTESLTPTIVSLFKFFSCSSNTLIIECILIPSPGSQCQLLWSFCTRPSPWVWAGCLETAFHSSYLHSQCIW